MAEQRTPLFVRLPRHQVAALDRLADASGRHKQHVLSELLADRLTGPNPPMAMGRVEVTHAPDLRGDDVLTLEEAATLLKLPVDAVRRRAEAGDLPGRRFDDAWRFARTALLVWLGTGEPLKRKRRAPPT
jgi:excisionase family DNA binding protein